jgi:hypothetical protein
LIGPNAGTAFLMAAVNAGTSAHTIFGGDISALQMCRNNCYDSYNDTPDVSRTNIVK